MTYSTLKNISVASVAATMFMGTMAVSSDVEPPKSPFDQSSPPCPTLGLGFSCPASAKDRCLILPEFNFIGVDDQGRNNSQFFKMDLTVPENSPNFLENFGKLYKGYDIEALDSTDPTKNPNEGTPWSCLFAASGDNDGGNSSCKTGCLYYLDKSDGSLALMGDICTQDKDLEEIDAMAFRPNGKGWEEIWGWSRSDGLFQIETPQPELGLCGDGREAVRADMICNIPNLVVEDMTWVEKEGVFYAYVANEKAIYKFDPDASCDNYEKVCTSKHEIEALEYISPDGFDLLVLGYNAAGNSVAAIALNNPRDPQGNCNLLDSTFPTGMDVEGLAYP